MSDAEQIVLGAMLRAEATAWEIRPMMRSEMFENTFHQAVFSTMTGLMDSGKRASISMVGARMGDQTQDGAPILPRLHIMVHLAQDAPWRDFLDEILQAWKERSLRGAMHAASQEIQKTGLDSAIAIIQDTISEIVEYNPHGSVSLQSLVADVIRKSNQALQSGVIGGLQTGVRSIDDRIGLMMPGELVVIGGPPGAGKTVLGAQVLRHIAQSGPTLFVEAEMPGRQIACRYLSAHTGLSVRTVWSGDLDFVQREELLDAEQALAAIQMQVWSDPDVTIEQIKQKAASMKRTGALSGIVVDHLALIEVGRGKKLDKWDRMETVARELKRIAVNENCVVICLSQVTKASQNADRPVPRLVDLDGGGALEKQADMAMVLFDRAQWILENKLGGIYPRRDSDEKTRAMDDYFASEGKVELHVVKNRSGKRGEKAVLRLRGSASRFEEID